MGIDPRGNINVYDFLSYTVSRRQCTRLLYVQNEEGHSLDVTALDSAGTSDSGSVLPGTSTLRFVVRQLSLPDGTVTYSYQLQPTGVEADASVDDQQQQAANLDGLDDVVEMDDGLAGDDQPLDGVPEKSRQPKGATAKARELRTQQQQQQQSQSGGSTPFDPRHNQEVFTEFLIGKRCFQGGGLSWWQYELCHLRHVVQFHLVSCLIVL